MNLIDRALKEGRTTLSEYESKQLLASYQIPVSREELADNPDDLIRVVNKIGFPVVIKGCAAEILHKTEKDLIRIDVKSA